MSETFAKFQGYSTGMKFAEVINLRSIYVEDKYYSCLVRSIPLLNFIIILALPFILIFKSKTLNRFLLRVEFLCFQIIIKSIVLAVMVILFPFFTIFLIFQKLYSIKKISEGNDMFRYILDIIIFILLSPFNAAYIILYWIIITGIHENRSSGFLKVTEIHKRKFKIVNSTLDRSNRRSFKDEVTNFDTYLFKKSLGREFKIENDPSNIFLAEVSVSILIATLKIMEIKAIEAKTYYLPTAFIVSQLRKYMQVDRLINNIIYFENSNNQDMDSFEELLEALADDSFGGLDTHLDIDEYPHYVGENNTNLILLNSIIRGHRQRVLFWRKKLERLFKYSNKGWLLDQYRYLKLFLYKNSYQEDSDKLTRLRKFEFIDNLIKRAQKKRELYLNDEKFIDTGLDQKEQENDFAVVETLNISSLLRGVVYFEKKCRLKLKSHDVDDIQNLWDSELYKDLARKNKNVFKQFISCNFSTNYSA